MNDRVNKLRRRAFLTLTGAAVTGLAGCTGSVPNATNLAEERTDVATPIATESLEKEANSDEQVHDQDEEHHETDSTSTDHHEDEEHHSEEDATEGEHGTKGPVPHVEVTVQTLESGHHFHPHVAWVEQGGTVTFYNESGAHTATAYHPDNGKPQRIPDSAESFDSGLLSEVGATFEHTFETEGVYDIYCRPHEGMGMIGSILVGRPDPHGQPGLSEPQSELSEQVVSKIEELNEQVESMLGHGY